ncbi:MAG: alpha-2-macroglobulin [Treponema sp.]|nr:alpha-2-macroglobulin [Treponema sp.]
MKKRNLFFKVFAVALAFTFTIIFPASCKKEKADGNTVASFNIKQKKSGGANASYTSLTLKTENNRVTFASMTDFFKPDYTAEEPDMPVSNEKTVQDKNSKKDKKGKQTSSFIPEIKKISEYKTQYFSERKSIPSYTAEKTEIEDENLSSTAFKVQDWGPQTSIVSEDEYPTFYVIFSQPVRALAALDKPSSTSDVVSITPALKGTFHWYGTQHLSFEAEEPADPSVEYIIKVEPTLKSIYGNPITGNIIFKTKAEPVKIKNIYGGYISGWDCAYDNTTGALPAYENRVFVRTNYLLKAESLADKLQIIIGYRELSKNEFTVEADFTNKSFSYWQNEPACDKERQTSNSFIVTINTTIPHNEVITLKSKDDTQRFTYKTLQPFDRVRVDDYAQYTEGNMGNPLKVVFTQAVSEQMVTDYMYVQDAAGNKIPITKDNILINGRYLTIHSLPLELNTEYKLFICIGFKDIYGQTYSDGQYNYYYTFKTKPVKAYVNYLDSGARMLEAQFPHKLIYEHQNIMAGSYYKIREFKNPLYVKTDGILIEDETFIDRGTENQRHFEEINLDPYLTNGYGFVRFDASTRFKDFDYWTDEEIIKKEENVLTIQVTDLGITTRMGINRAVVMVRSLSTNEPVADADVYILQDCTNVAGDPLNQLIAQGKTDSNGLAVINYTEDQIKAYESVEKYNYYYDDNLTVYVEKGYDKAMFTPKSHNTWRDGVTTGSRQNARKPVQRTFMFVDRYLYKPGEIVTFRGIDRDQVLGAINVHTGDYTITAEEGWWNGEQIIEPIKGTLSSSGGFYGSFKIPDSQEPGYYNIIYKRAEAEGKYDYQSIRFQIAEFERVKTTASLTAPDITYYNGDTLTAELSAEYLAGGVLSGASYSGTWYKRASSPSFNTPETKGYNFSPDVYSYGSYYSDVNGTLDGDGKAFLVCNSEKITDGSAYTYRIEANVTDISNQRISRQTSMIVHPAKFYVGVKRSSNTNGFAKTNTKLDFSYILTDTQGNLLENPTIKAAELSYELSREEWTMIHEQSIDNTVYTKYEKQIIDEAKGSLKIESNGTLSITPVSSGWYTLRLIGIDKDDNKVITEYEFYVTGGQTYSYNDYNSEAITLTPDQSQYNPGDTAQILMECPLPAGDYLITVEREGIFTEEIKHFDSPSNVIEIPIASNYVPVIYVAVSSYSVRHGTPTHQYGEPDLDKPKGYFGVTPVFVNPYVRAFSVTVESDKPSYKPGETATLTLTATKGGKALSNAELTVMAVDRGVIDVVDYHVQNPIDFFYSSYNFPLRVKGGDSRALLMDPVTYSIKDLQGGDSEDEEKDEDERKDFRPTAVFEPAVVTDKNGKATVTFKVPDSLTTYRVTAFGVKDDLFALQEDEFTVQNPINVQQVQPRRLRERDTAECGVLITNLDANGHDVTISLETRSPTKNTAQDELEGRITVPGKAFIDGEAEHTVYVESGDSTVVYFNVGAETEGTVELVYTVKSDIINEKLNSPIKIEKTYTYETVTSLGTIDNESDNAKAIEQIAIPGFAKDGRGDLTFTIDATRLGILGGAVNYLFDYPYGCLEQQSARILPLIAFKEYIDVFGLDSKIADIDKCIKTYLASWGKYQLSNGGFPYWPSGSVSSAYVSLRMAYIYALGINRGYKEADFGFEIKPLLNYIYSQSVIHTDSSYDYTKAYTAYIYCLLGKSDMDMIMDSLYNKRDDLSLSAEAMLGLAYVARGNRNNGLQKAEVLAQHIRQYLKPDTRTVTVLRKTRSNMWDWYNSDTEQMATILQFLCSVNPNDQMVDKLIYTLLQEQKHGYWTNTASTSRVLEAIYTYIKERKLDETNYTADMTLAGSKVISGTFNGAAAKPKTLSLPFEDEIIAKLQKDKAENLTIQKDGKGNLYYTVEMRYALPDEYLEARSEGLKVEYTIIDGETGEVVNKSDSSDCLLNLTSGKVYKASIRVEAHKDYEYVALRAPIPSGAEILDSSFVTTGSLDEDDNSNWSWRHWLSNKIIRDNEVQFFWDSFGSGATTVNFTFRASRRGIYPVPPVQAECMYEPETFGRGDGYLCIIE